MKMKRVIVAANWMAGQCRNSTSEVRTFSSAPRPLRGPRTTQGHAKDGFFASLARILWSSFYSHCLSIPFTERLHALRVLFSVVVVRSLLRGLFSCERTQRGGGHVPALNFRGSFVLVRQIDPFQSAISLYLASAPYGTRTVPYCEAQETPTSRR